MTHEDQDPIHEADIPIGYHPMRYFGRDESKARAFRANQGKELVAILVISDNGKFSVWKCIFSVWPRC